MDVLFRNVLVLVRGGGDLASGVAYRLFVAGFPVIVTELPAPLLIRRKACYGTAVFEGHVTVDGLTAQRVQSPAEALATLGEGRLPVLADASGGPLATHLYGDPAVLVDGRMAKTNLGTRKDDAPLVVGLGPGFTASLDCHAVVETNRGHNLGRVIWDGSPEPDTKTPGLIGTQRARRVLRAPADGHVEGHAEIGDLLEEGQLVASVNGHDIRAPFRGALRGLIHPSVAVTTGLKVGDVDPRANPDYCDTISDKALAVGGGVLEAVLASQAIRERLFR
jgi:xanthine dehydrogenase accessory factor